MTDTRLSRRRPLWSAFEEQRALDLLAPGIAVLLEESAPARGAADAARDSGLEEIEIAQALTFALVLGA